MIYYGVSLSFPILNMFTLRTEIVDAFPKKVDWRKVAIVLQMDNKTTSAQ